MLVLPVDITKTRKQGWQRNYLVTASARQRKTLTMPYVIWVWWCYLLTSAKIVTTYSGYIYRSTKYNTLQSVLQCSLRSYSHPLSQSVCYRYNQRSLSTKFMEKVFRLIPRMLHGHKMRLDMTSLIVFHVLRCRYRKTSRKKFNLSVHFLVEVSASLETLGLMRQKYPGFPFRLIAEINNCEDTAVYLTKFKS